MLINTNWMENIPKPESGEPVEEYWARVETLAKANAIMTILDAERYSAARQTETYQSCIKQLEDLVSHIDRISQMIEQTCEDLASGQGAGKGSRGDADGKRANQEAIRDMYARFAGSLEALTD